MDLIFSPSMLGLSLDEKKKLNELEWKLGELNDLAGEDYTFFLQRGQIEHSGRFIHPGEQALGIKPFVQNRRENYKTVEGHDHLIAYLPTKEFAAFLLENMKALQSYLMYERNFGAEPLPLWRKFPRTIGFSSSPATWQTIHLALSTAYELTQKQHKKCIFVELQPDGMSVYSMIQRDPSVSVLHTEDGVTDIRSLLGQRMVKYHQIDILNINHLSNWELEPEQWTKIYWELAKRYDYIFLHFGVYRNDRLMEQCDGIYQIRKSNSGDRDKLKPQSETTLWPPVHEIFTDAEPTPSDRELKYKLYFRGSTDIADIPLPENLDDSYWGWLRGKILKNMVCRKASIFGDSVGHEPDPDRLWKGAPNPYESYTKFLEENVVIAEGCSGLWVSFQHLLMKTGETGMDYQVPVIVRKIITQMKPVYPKAGFFALKSFYSTMPSLFEEIEQLYTEVYLPVYSPSRENLCFLSEGELLENLSYSAWPAGFIDREGNANYSASETAYWKNMMAICFRYGFDQLDFYEFQRPKNLFQHMPALRLIFERANRQSTAEVSGRFINHYMLDFTE